MSSVAARARHAVIKRGGRILRRILFTKLGIVIVVISLVIMAALVAVAGAMQDAAAQSQKTTTPTSIAGVHPVVLTAITHAASRANEVSHGCTIRWPLLAAIGEIESNNASGSGRQISEAGDVTPPIYGASLNGSGVGGNLTPIHDTDNGAIDGDPTYDRAVGYLQFIPTTWRAVAKDGNGDQKTNPQNVFDAALTAVAYLCGGQPVDLTQQAPMRRAIFRYNLSNAYVSKVLAAVERYEALAAAVPPSSGGAGAGPVSDMVEKAISFALAQLGQPYLWGGNGPPQHSGYDCSGLTKRAYADGGVTLPRTSREQWASRPSVARAGDGLDRLRRGDLVYWAYDTRNPSTIHHVALYLGDGQIVEAPTQGVPVRQRSMYFNGFIGANRPA